MSDSIKHLANVPNQLSIIDAKNDLAKMLAESAKYTNEECEDFDVFFKRMSAEINEKL